MPVAQLPGLKMYYNEKGDGQETFLLVHGNVSSSEYFERVNALFPSSSRIIAPDLRGCGQTEHTGGGYDIAQFVEDLDRLTGHLGLDRFHLMGHSMGGQTSMLYTLTHPKKVRTLCLLDSVPADGLFLNDEIRASFHLLLQDREVLRQVMRDMVVPYGEGPAFAERAFEIAAACAPQTILDNPESMHRTNFLFDLSRITVPTLIIHGKDDLVIPLESMVPTMKALADARVFILTRCGHSPQVERPEEVAEIYLPFAARYPMA
jgi:pimeloyl-ACP methyl ester carboxylesterase